MKGLYEDLLATSKVNRRLQCGVAKALADLKPAVRTDLVRALAEPRIQGEAIARKMTELGQRIQGNTVRRHRNGACSCG